MPAAISHPPADVAVDAEPLITRYDPGRDVYVEAMGLVYADVTVRLLQTNKRGVGEGISLTFLVDSGAFTDFIPEDVLEELGVEPLGHRDIVLADGSKARLKEGRAELEVTGFDGYVSSDVIFAPRGSEALLGVRTMQALRIRINPKYHRVEDAGPGPINGRREESL